MWVNWWLRTTNSDRLTQCDICNDHFLLTLRPRLKQTKSLKSLLMSVYWSLERPFRKWRAVNRSRPILVGLGLGLLMKSLILGPKTAGSLLISWMQKAASLLPWCLWIWTAARLIAPWAYLVQIALAWVFVVVQHFSRMTGITDFVFFRLAGVMSTISESARSAPQAQTVSLLSRHSPHVSQRTEKKVNRWIVKSHLRIGEADKI